MAFDFKTFTKKRNAEVDRLNALHISLLEKAGVALVTGHAQLEDAHTVRVGDALYKADKILITTGGRPVKPNIPGAELGLTSDDLWALDTLPKRIAVIGAGYIGVEFAGIFKGLGSTVALIYRHDLPLRGFDRETAALLVDEMTKRGIDCHSNTSPTQIEKTNDGYRLGLNTNKHLDVDLVVFATGRIPNTDTIGLDKAGVTLNPNGTIPVDGQFATNIPHIFAIGDMANETNLTPVAIRDGRIFADNQFGGKSRKSGYDAIATAIFSQPPIGTVGLSEEEATTQFGDDLKLYKANFKPIVHTLSGRDERIFMKIITQKSTDVVLGMHMMGRDAGEIIQGFAVPVSMGATKAQLDNALAIHPTSAEEFVTMSV